MRLTRRRFIAKAGTTASAVGFAATSRFVAAPIDGCRRIARLIQEYDAQGYHRTGTDVDHRSGEWLLAQVRNVGVSGSLEPFTLNRVDPHTAFVQQGDRRIAGLPLFDGSFTGAEGVTGRLGLLNSEAEIGLVQYDIVVGEAGRKLADIRRATRHKAVVVVTRGGHEGLCLVNAPNFTEPFGPPILQVASDQEEPLAAAAREHAEVSVMAYATRTRVQAYNVTAHISGVKASLSPVVIMTPRSGWWHCAAERGGGLACWLEVMRKMRSLKPQRPIEFVASSGHELGYLGIKSFLERHSGFVKARSWVIFGANVGSATEANNLLQASDDQIENMAAEALQDADVTVHRRMRRSAVPDGETSAIDRAGARYVSILGANRFFHNIADRWPAAVDVKAVDQHARAFTRVAQALCRA